MDHIHEVEMFIFNLQFGFCVLPIGRVSNGEDSLTEESLKTMSRYRKMTTICCAAVFALGLAACGGGDDGISVADRDAAVAAEQAKTEALQMEINALRAQLGLDPEDDPAASIQDLQDEVARLQGEITKRDDKARMDQEEADRMAAAKTGKELLVALAGPADGNALDHITEGPSLDSSGLMINGVTLKAGADAGSLGSWSGMNYAHTNADTKVMNEAVVYTNRGAGKMETFVQRYGDDEAYTPSTSTYNVDETPNKKIKSSAFPDAGTKTLPNNQNVEGTFDGAAGRYKCPSDCTATYTASGIQLSAGWTFVHNAGAMVSTASDADYLYYGWWVSKNKDGMPTAASAFAGQEGNVDDDGSNGHATVVSGTALAGSAMYAGHAAGKFALDYSKNKLLDGASDGGHFTADVMLTAKFGANGGTNNGGVSGTIDNFMANGESVPWSVELKRAGWDSSDAMFGTDNGNEAMTVWSIDGTPAPGSGGWSGRMHDEMPGNAPKGDGSNIPTTVTGTFHSNFESVGTMVGAFGANKQ